MLRHTSSIQSVLVYATFFTISLMIHMVIVWPQPTQGAGPAAEGAAPVSSEAAPAETGAAPGAKRAEAARTEVLK